MIAQTPETILESNEIPIPFVEIENSFDIKIIPSANRRIKTNLGRELVASKSNECRTMIRGYWLKQNAEKDLPEPSDKTAIFNRNLQYCLK